MSEGTILITAPSLDTKHNVSGISSVVNFIIANNPSAHYTHFELGRKDNEKRNLLWLFKITGTALRWMWIVVFKKISLVHFNFPLSKASVLRDAPLILFAKLVRKKLVIHLHGGDFLTNTNTPGWMKWMLNRVFAGKMPVVVLSELEKKLVKERYGVANVEVLPNCTDLTVARQFERYNFKDAVLKILFIGRISHAKGLDSIYEILIALKQAGQPFRFYMAGTGPEEAVFMAKFTGLLGNDFVFKGVVSGSVKDDVMKECHIFLLPSHFEGLPVSLLECMSFAMVPVVSNVGSIGGVVTTGENGFITEPGDMLVTKMTDAITSLLNNRDQLEQLGKNAAAYISKNFSPEEYISKLNRIYKAA